jgi:flagellar motor switch protein FliM
MMSTPEDSARVAISAEEVSALLEKGPTGAAVPFDLAQRRVSRTQLPMLEYVCKSFAERVGPTLSSLLGREATMQFESLRFAKTVDLQAALPAPATVALVRLKPLPNQAFISIDPALLLVLLDGFFGGSGRAAGDPQAVVAPAAQRFCALLVRSFAADLGVAWAPVAPVELELVSLETNPRFLRMGEPQDKMVVASYTVVFGAHSGRVDWMLPESLLLPVREALASDNGKTAERAQAPWAPVLGASLQYAQLEARAVLANAQISLGELVRLAPGDIIPIDAPQQVSLLAGDVPLYHGKFGISQGRNALKIVARGGT